MNLRTFKALAVAAPLLLAAAACTDPTVAPKSSVTGANIWNGPNAYSEYMAKLYSGLILTGQVGRVLKSEVAWYNPNEGLGIVFEAPPKEAYRVKLYLRSANAIAAPFGPRSAFCPGVLLYTKMGPSTLEGAMQMGRTTPPGSDGTMGQV